MAAEARTAPRASAIVCTHNNSASLRRAIASLLRCAGDDRLFEIVVVDNASTDETKQVVVDLMRDAHPRALRYVREDRLGLHFARHLGASAARAPLLLYTDDDVEVAPDWVEAYVGAFASHPRMLAAGGRVLPRWEAEPPDWVRETVGNDLATRGMCSQMSLIDLGDNFTPDAGTFFGVNMAIRPGALASFGGFQPESFGARYVGAGEWGLYRSMRRAGAAVGYVPQALVWHRIPRSRMRPEYFERWAWIGTAAEMFERWRGRARTTRSLASDLTRILRTYGKTWLRYPFTRRRPEIHAVRLRSRAQAGFCELVYLWWIVSRAELRHLLDAETYWP